jgi:hypothetical protein
VDGSNEPRGVTGAPGSLPNEGSAPTVITPARAVRGGGAEAEHPFSMR